MTYSSARRLVDSGITIVAAAAFVIVPIVAQAGIQASTEIALAAGLFIILYALGNAASKNADRALHRGYFRKPETKLLADFAERIGTSFSILDLVEAAREDLEKKGDMGVVFLKSNSWEVIYQSPAAAASDEGVLEALRRNFRELPDGLGFFDESYEPIPSNRGARGFAIHVKGFHFFVLSRLCPLIEPEAFRTLLGELGIYFDRVVTIADLFEVASLSKEWELVAQTQRSFLPKTLPQVKKLDLSVLYRPLVNVSGDYYDVLPIDEDRTLILVGDVSGKGLAAALIMGIIVNTVRIADDKSDLAALVRSVDKAVRDMGFDDKYTVLFLGLVDTKNRHLRYVNAAMADPIIVSQTALGPRVRRLEPTMGLVGLVPIEDIGVEELPLRTDEIILLASDGVTEIEGEAGGRLGDTELFDKTLAQSSKVGAAEFVASVSGLLYSYVGDRPLKDDVTILAAKVGRLWD